MAKMTPRTLSGFMELLPGAPAADGAHDGDPAPAPIPSTASRPWTPRSSSPARCCWPRAAARRKSRSTASRRATADLALRFDLTVPLAKYVALHYNDLSFPFRRYQIGKVYRGERAQRGRFREFYQADIDIIGDGKLDIINEAEIPAIIYQTFSTLGLKRFQIRVNNRKILNGFYAMLGLTEKSGDIMRTVDKLDKIGPEKVKAILVEDFAVGRADADEILKFIAITGSNDEVLAALEGYQGRNEIFDQGLERAEHRGAVSGRLRRARRRTSPWISPSPGAWTTTPAPSTRPRCWTTRRSAPSAPAAGMTIWRSTTPTSQLPGVGISIGLTRLFYVLGEQGMLNPELPTAPADVLILPMTEDLSPAIAAGHPAAGRRASAPSSTASRRSSRPKIELCRQAGHPLCDLPGRGRDQRRRGGLQGHGHRRADQTEVRRRPSTGSRPVLPNWKKEA